MDGFPDQNASFLFPLFIIAFVVVVVYKIFYRRKKLLQLA